MKKKDFASKNRISFSIKGNVQKYISHEILNGERMNALSLRLKQRKVTSILIISDQLWSEGPSYVIRPKKKILGCLYS